MAEGSAVKLEICIDVDDVDRAVELTAAAWA